MSIENRSLKLPHSSGVLCGQKRSIFGEGIGTCVRITEAIAPIWEANHVWLIVIVVLLFVAFPVAFAAISGQSRFIPLSPGHFSPENRFG